MTHSRRIDPANQTAQRGMTDQTLCAVQLIDRRTGAIHRVNGRPMLVVTRKPQDAATELMSGRDASVWETRIDSIEQIAG